jgi:hypothetical protein
MISSDPLSKQFIPKRIQLLPKAEMNEITACCGKLRVPITTTFPESLLS